LGGSAGAVTEAMEDIVADCVLGSDIKLGNENKNQFYLRKINRVFHENKIKLIIFG